MKGQILIIDDNPIDIRVASTALERSGYGCFGFVDHEKGLNWLETNSPRLIFLDLQLHGTTGYELTAEIKKLPSSKDTPIVIISGKNEIEDVRKAIAVGAKDYVVKPLDALVLQEKVEKLIGENTESFHTVDWPEDQPSDIHIRHFFQILSLSEFGIKAQGDFCVMPGETFDLYGLPENTFGTDRLFVRCLSSDPHPHGQGYIMQFTFVGMTESLRQSIRKSCRQLWIKAKSDHKK